MTTLREAARQVLEALEFIDKEFKKHGRQHWPEAVKAHSAIAPLRAALAKPVQEPVAWIDDSGHPKHIRHLQSVTERRLYGPLRPLYTAPPQRKPLTDEEIYGMYSEPSSDAEMVEFARAIERAHGIGEQP